ncbi:MAG: hypothetical protein ACI9MR_004542 [Myxococcota bacterium]|jgi:hypothetical protein
MSEYQLQWLTAFAMTLAIEVPIYVLVLRKPMRGWAQPLFVGILAQCITHWAVWFVAPHWELSRTDYVLWLLLVELGVTLVEALWVALWLSGLGWKRALFWGLLVSLLANVVSTLIGVAR